MKSKSNETVYQKPAAVVLLALLCCGLWGSAFPVIKLGYRMMEIEDAGSQLLYGGLRFFLAGIITLAFAAVTRGAKGIMPRSMKLVFAQGLLQTTCQYVFYYIGLANCSSTKSAVINASSTFFAILVSPLLIKGDRLSWRKWLGCMLGFGGIVVMNLTGFGTGGAVSLVGEGFVLIGTIAYGVSSVTMKLIGRREDPAVITGWQFILGSAVMLIIGLSLGGKLDNWSPMAALLMLYLAAVAAVAFTVWSQLLKYNPVSRIAVYCFSIPIFGMFWSALLLGERAFTPLNIAALMLVCVGIFIVNRQPEGR